MGRERGDPVLESDGITGMLVLKRIVSSLPWTTCIPSDHMLSKQPGILIIMRW